MGLVTWKLESVVRKRHIHIRIAADRQYANHESFRVKMLPHWNPNMAKSADHFHPSRALTLCQSALDHRSFRNVKLFPGGHISIPQQLHFRIDCSGSQRHPSRTCYIKEAIRLSWFDNDDGPKIAWRWGCPLVCQKLSDIAVTTKKTRLFVDQKMRKMWINVEKTF